MNVFLNRLVGYKKQAQKMFLEANYTLKQNRNDFLAPHSKSSKVAILMYHGIVKAKPSLFNYRHLSCADFEIQLKLLKQHCNVVSVSDLFSKQLPTDRLNVAITFDDGFKNNYLNAAPLLEKYNLPASFYITGSTDDGFEWLWPDFLDIMARHASSHVEILGRTFKNNGKYFKDENTGELLSDIIRNVEPRWDYKKSVYKAFGRWLPNLYRPDYRPFWELMNVDEIQELSKNPLFTIGSHGYYHNNLGSLTTNDAMDELKKSKTYLEQMLGAAVDELAYPDGSYTKDLVKAAKNHGFSYQLGVLPRFNEGSESREPAFRYGLYSFAYPRTQLIEMLQTSFKWEN